MLTKILRSSFTRRDAKTVVLATASPAAKDTEHTINTLRHACVMDGRREAQHEQHSWLGGGEVFKEEGDVDSSFDDSFDLDQSVTPPYPDGGTPPDVSPRLAPLDADRNNVLNMSAGVPTEWSL